MTTNMTLNNEEQFGLCESGCLQVVTYDEKHFWKVGFDPGEMDWEQIPKYLWEALVRYYNEPYPRNF